MIDIIIIGGGNLSESLSQAVEQCPTLNLKQMYVRNTARADELRTLVKAPICTLPEQLDKGDLYILATSDGAIEELASTLPIPEEAVVVHTSGSTPLEALSMRKKRYGVFYPMQTFTRGRKLDFSVIPIFTEACDTETHQFITEVAQALSRSVTPLDSAKRREMHLAAIFVCNFTNALYGAGNELLAKAELPFHLLSALILETAAKATDLQNPKAAQTGPARRGDMTTINRHLEMLEKGSLHDIYKLISQYIWETSKKM